MHPPSNRPDDPAPPARAYARAFLQSIAAMARIFYCNLRHGRETRRLAAFSDEQLKDIGLRRDDLRHAMHIGPSQDPTTCLARQAMPRPWKTRSRGQ